MVNTMSKFSQYWLKNDNPRILVQQTKHGRHYYDATGHKLFDAALIVLQYHVNWYGIDDPEALRALKEDNGELALEFILMRSDHCHEYESIDITELIDPLQHTEI